MAFTTILVITQQRSHDEAEEAVEPRVCPYVGLDYDHEEFGAWFFGREADGSKIITNMQAARLTLLHAESGVGKSSLLRAGVAWRLASPCPMSRPGLRLTFLSYSVPGRMTLSWAWFDAIGTTIEPLLAGRTSGTACRPARRGD